MPERFFGISGIVKDRDHTKSARVPLLGWNQKKDAITNSEQPIEAVSIILM